MPQNISSQDNMLYRQILYQSNVDYQETYEKLVESRLAIVDKTERGLLWFRFRNSRTVFQISPKGKIQAIFQNLEEKKRLWEVLKRLLVPVQGQNLSIYPLKQTLTIPYPAPSDLKIAWCSLEQHFKRCMPTRQKISFALLSAITIITTLLLVYIITSFMPYVGR